MTKFETLISFFIFISSCNHMEVNIHNFSINSAPFYFILGNNLIFIANVAIVSKYNIIKKALILYFFLFPKKKEHNGLQANRK